MSVIDSMPTTRRPQHGIKAHRLALACAPLLLLVGCRSPSREIDAGMASAAAMTLMESSRPWASQAPYKPRRQAAGWTVIVICKHCETPAHGHVSARYVVRINTRGKARIVTGFEK
jgi:hypothetical protein